MIIYKNKLNVYRLKASESYLNDDGIYVEGTASQEIIPIRCSLQPYTNGNENIELPSGAKSEDAVFVYTKTFIRQIDDRQGVNPDEIEVEGVRYECYRVKNYTGFGLITDHYECVFLKKDKL